jgi:hypothetical protein
MPIDATRPYDDTNIFARILRGELPCNKVYGTITFLPSGT